MVRIRSDRDPASSLVRETEEFDVEIQPVRIGVDLEGGLCLDRGLEHARPVGGEAEPVIPSAPAWMGEDVDVGVADGGEVAIGLILGDPQLRVERAEDEVELLQDLRGHVALAPGERFISIDRSSRMLAPLAPSSSFARSMSTISSSSRSSLMPFAIG